MSNEKELPAEAEAEHQGTTDLSGHPDGPPDTDLDLEYDDDGTGEEPDEDIDLSEAPDLPSLPELGDEG